MSIGMKQWSVAGAALMLLAACETPPRPEPVVDRYGVNVAAEHSGSSITLASGQELVVRLTTIASPTSEWSLVDFKPGVLAGKTAPEFEREIEARNPIQAVGNEVWRFRPAAAGTVTLKFHYRPMRTLDPATQTVTYTVTVR
jgi:predicted secreted protein